jgi:hypothetical protein
LQWEILPRPEQILSENATPEHWNNILRKLESIFYKYFAGPDLVDAVGHRINDQRLKEIFLEEAGQYAASHPGDGLSERAFILYGGGFELRNKHTALSDHHYRSESTTRQRTAYH